MLNEYDKNKRVYPVMPKSASSTSVDSGTIGKDPVKDGWESLDSKAEEPVQAKGSIQQVHEKVVAASKSWPDGGINRSSWLRPSDVGEDDEVPGNQNQKIHSVSLSNDLNDWGGIDAVLSQVDDTDAEDLDNIRTIIGLPAFPKIGPGNYPEDRPPEFFHNLSAERELKYIWLVPGILAAGAHPILTSHLDDLSAFKKAGFKAIISVFDKPLDPKYLKGFHYHFAPTIQGFIGNLTAICQFIDAQESLNNPVFVHSLDGNGRAAAVLAAYLVHMNYLTAEEAIGYVRQHYSKSAITTAQENEILKFALQS